jgi:hypothetical protein
MKEKERIVRLNRKQGVLTHYGNGECACVWCGFKDIRALSIDHIHDNGRAHRREIHRSLYNWLIDNDFPEGYQTLCMNCQFIKNFNKDKISLSPKHQNVVAKRVEHWVKLREQGFTINDVMIGLGLPSSKRAAVKTSLHRLCKKGLLRRKTFFDGSIMGGYFLLPLKQVKPVKVFDSKI